MDTNATPTKREMLSVLSEDILILAERFDRFADSLGCGLIPRVGARAYRLVYYKAGTRKQLFTLEFTAKRFVVRANLHHIGTYIDSLLAMPKEIVDTIKLARRCTKCNPSRCKSIVKFEIGGVSYNPCEGAAFLFKNLDENGWEAVMELLKIESTII